MIKNINYTLLLIATAFALNACDSKEKSGSNGDSLVVDSAGNKNPEVKIENPATAPLTKLEFSESLYDFGKINEGEKVNHIFKFTNTGDKPLMLQDARASCGCTVPEYTKDTIAPGASGEIKVIFDSSGKNGKIDKTVTVTANTEPATTDIKITGFVQKKVDGPYNKQ
jgi:hypothetical protein